MFSWNVRVPGNCIENPSFLFAYACRSGTFCPVMVVVVVTVAGQLFAHPKRKSNPATNVRENNFFILFMLKR